MPRMKGSLFVVVLRSAEVYLVMKLPPCFGLVLCIVLIHKRFVCRFFPVGRSAIMYCRDKDETQILAFHKTPTSQVLRRDGRLNSKAPSPIRRLQPPMGYSGSVVLQMPE